MTDDPTSGTPIDPAEDDPETAGWVREPEQGFVGLVGPIYSRRDGAGLRFGFRAGPHHANLVGHVQGGMIMTFADRALGMMAWEAAQETCVTVSFDTQFVGAGRIGAWHECEGEIVRRTARLVFVRGRIVVGHHVVASCQGVWARLPGHKGGSSGDRREDETAT